MGENMSKYHHTKLDANHLAIADHLREQGIEVENMAGSGRVPDMVCYHDGAMCWLEVKVDVASSRWTQKQLWFIAQTKMPVAVAKTKEQALEYVTKRRYVTQKQKDTIAVLLMKYPKDLYQAKDIDKILQCH